MHRSPEGESECSKKNEKKQVIQEHDFFLFPGIEEGKEDEKKDRD